MTASLREFIGRLRQEKSLLVVQREVDPRFELNAVVRKIQDGPNLPVLFEQVRGARFPVVSNALGNYRILADQLGVPIDQAAAKWAALTAGGGVPAESHPDEDPRWEEIPFTDVPHLTFSEKDAGPYLTASAIVARDPDTQVVNLSFHRMQMVGPNEMRMRLSPSGDLYRIQQKHEARGEATPAVVAIGLPPTVMLAASATIGPDNSEYDLAARISGKRFPMRETPGLHLPVPASTEFLIEGEILATERRPEGPFGEWMDYYTPVMANHVFIVKHVYARRDATFYAISAGSAEELAMTALPIAGSIYNSIRTWVTSVKDVTCFPLLQFCFVKIAKQFEGQAQRAIVAAFGAEMNRTLYCVVVDEDVNIHDPKDVLWAMATRCRPDTGTFTIPGVPSFARDPHKTHWGRLGIDATKKIEHAADFERKKAPGLDTINLDEYLKPLR